MQHSGRLKSNHIINYIKQISSSTLIKRQRLLYWIKKQGFSQEEHLNICCPQKRDFKYKDRLKVKDGKILRIY